jgi:hypothetical protein
MAQKRERRQGVRAAVGVDAGRQAASLQAAANALAARSTSACVIAGR